MQAAMLDVTAAALQCPSNSGIVERTLDVICEKKPVRKQLHVQSKLHPHAYKQDQRRGLMDFLLYENTYNPAKSLPEGQGKETPEGLTSYKERDTPH